MKIPVLFFLLLLCGTAAPETLEEQARALERRLIAPCCWRQPLADHLSPESDRLKQEIRLMLGEGRTKDEILDHYVQEYGQAILAQPSYQGFNLLAYALPALFLLALGGWLARVVVKSRPRPTAGPPPVVIPSGPYAAQLARNLRELDE